MCGLNVRWGVGGESVRCDVVGRGRVVGRLRGMRWCGAWALCFGRMPLWGVLVVCVGRVCGWGELVGLLGSVCGLSVWGNACVCGILVACTGGVFGWSVRVRCEGVLLWCYVSVYAVGYVCGLGGQVNAV